MPSPRSCSPSVAVAAVCLWALSGALSACGSGAQCALDSDCALGLRCSLDNRCVPRGGGGVDAGSGRDSGPRADAGAMTDAPASDAPASDAPAFDAPARSDADLDAFATCPTLASMYMVVRSGPVCMSMATTVSFSRVAGEPCSYEVSSDIREDVVGTMAYSGTGTSFSGGLSFPDVGRPCTLEIVGEDVFIVCGVCSLDLSP